MSLNTGIVLTLLVLAFPASLSADELVQIIQQDLVRLGYDPGGTDGELGTKTIVAISKFQAENDLEVTGEATPQLAGIIRAAINKPAQAGAGSPAAPAVTAAPQQDQAALQAAQQACLEEKYAAAQASQKKKRGFGRLLSAVSRTGSLLGNSSTAGRIAGTAGTIYTVNATAADYEAAAKDLGLTEDDLAACRNP